MTRAESCAETRYSSATAGGVVITTAGSQINKTAAVSRLGAAKQKWIGDVRRTMRHGSTRHEMLDSSETQRTVRRSEKKRKQF